MLTILWPRALLGFRLLIIFAILSFVKETEVKDWSVVRERDEGSLLELAITEPWRAKISLNYSASSLKFVISLFR